MLRAKSMMLNTNTQEERESRALLLFLRSFTNKKNPAKNDYFFSSNYTFSLLLHQFPDNLSIIPPRWRKWGPPELYWVDTHEIRLPGNRRRVLGRRGGVRAELRVQPAHLSHHPLHQLRCAAEEQCALLATWRLLLQL